MKDINEIPEKIVFIMPMEHVTFAIAASSEMEEWCILYSESKQRGVQKLGEGYFEDVQAQLEEEMNKLSATLEAKRTQTPTPNQLMFLFREKIPIPLDLTWGVASDLIDERLAQIQRKKQEKYRHSIVVEAQYIIGDKVHHPEFGSGLVLRSRMVRGEEHLDIQFDTGKKQLNTAYERLVKQSSGCDMTLIELLMWMKKQLILYSSASIFGGSRDELCFMQLRKLQLDGRLKPFRLTSLPEPLASCVKKHEKALFERLDAQSLKNYIPPQEGDEPLPPDWEDGPF